MNLATLSATNLLGSLGSTASLRITLF